MKSQSVTTEMKAAEQHFPSMVPFVFQYFAKWNLRMFECSDCELEG